MNIQVDPRQLSLGDLEDVEEYTGVPIGEVFGRLGDGTYTSKMFVALAWVAGRKTNPNFTVEDARNVTQDQLEIVGGDEDPFDPEADDN